jgi:hypothetical protein
VRSRLDIAAASGLVLLPFAVLGRALLPGHVLSPADILLIFPPWSILAPGLRMANPLLTDVAFMFHPWLIYAGREIAAGRFPLWNPHSFGGVPFFANPQTALLFPLTWIAYVLPAALAITLTSILKFSVAGAGMYWFLRLLAIRPLPAVVGALAFMLNAALVTWVQWAVGTAMAMLPLLFAATEHLRQVSGRRAVALLAAIVGVSILGGYLQITALALLAAGAWALAGCRSTSRPLAFLGRWAVGVGLGIVLAGAQILPFVEYSRLSSVYAYRSQWMPVMAAPPRAAIALLMPQYFGTPTGRDFWGYWNYNEIAAAVGIVPWLVLPAAIVCWRRPGTRFFLGLAALAAVMCYEVPWLTQALGSLPPFSLVITFRLVIFLAFSLSALCALGLDALLAAPAGRRRVLAAGVAAGFAVTAAVALVALIQDGPLLAGLSLARPIAVQYGMFLALLTLGALAALRLSAARRRVALDAAIALVAVQLAGTVELAATYNPIIDTRLFYPPAPPALRHVQAETAREPGRVMFGIGKNMGMLYGLHEITGYDGMTPRHVEQLVSPLGAGGLLASGSINATVPWASPVFDLLGVRRLIVPRDADTLPSHFALEYDGDDARVFVNPRALPRAFVVEGARCADDAATLDLMYRGAVDFRRQVLVAGCGEHVAGTPPDRPVVASLSLMPVVGDGRETPALEAGAGGRPAPASAAAGDARAGAAGPGGHAAIQAEEPERLVVSSESGTPGWLVVTDTWFPGWRATVDGVAQPLWRADHAFRAVRVPAGRHTVEFAYRPASFRAGLALTGLAAMAIAGLAFWPALRRGAGLAAILAALVAAAPVPARASTLPAAPLDIDIRPSPLRIGAEAAIRIEPRAGAGAAEYVDLHLVRIPSGPPFFRYLTPTGAWSKTITPYLRGVLLPRLAPVTATWREDGDPGWISVLVVFTRPGANPADRVHWVFQPVMRRLMVRPAAGGRGRLPIGWLAAATLAAAAGVVAGAVGWSRPAP